MAKFFYEKMLRFAFRGVIGRDWEGVWEGLVGVIGRTGRGDWKGVGKGGWKGQGGRLGRSDGGCLGVAWGVKFRGGGRGRL